MKKIIALALVLALTFGALATSGSAAFSDVSDPEFSSKLELLSALGIVSGYSDGTFRPAQPLTRAEFTKLVVTLLGADEASLAYADYTYFPDVRSTHWAARYVNYASRALGLVKGDGTGLFNPDKSITYREALTIVMRALGYTDEIVGGRWPDGYFAKGDALGLTDGISLGSTSPVSRQAGAELFYNALYTERQEGGALIDTLAGELVRDLLIISVSVKASDGSPDAVLASNGTVYKTRNPLSGDLVGRRGTLILDDKGYAVGFIPEEQTVLSLVISRTDSGSLTAVSGEYLRVKSTAPVYTGEGGSASKTWADCWYNLGAGTSVRVTVGASGEVEYVTASLSSASSSAIVLESVPTHSALCGMLGAPTSAKIVKNGVPGSVSDLRPYDVATYSEASGTINVSDFRLTVIYEGASPSTYTPDTITAFGGNTFNALESAAESLRTFAVGSAMTLLFTSDGQVAGAVASSLLSATSVGYYDGSNVLFPSGVSIKATLDADAGQLVRVYQSYAGKLSSVNISMGMYKTSAWDVSGMTVDGNPVLPGVHVYEQIGPGGSLNRVELSDITLSTIPASKVLYIGYDSSNHVNLIVINDITGNGHVYGMLTTITPESSSTDDEDTSEDDSGGDNISIDNSHISISVFNSSGRNIYPTNSHYNFQMQWGSVVITKDGWVQSARPLIEFGSVSLSAFTGVESVKLANINVRFADDLQIYVKSSGTFLTPSNYSSTGELIGSAKNMGNSFTMLLDRNPGDGGVVRVIVVE